jgi:ABC-type nitrate/sulfonate/bicarbonate transport system substrate-binding protein
MNCLGRRMPALLLFSALLFFTSATVEAQNLRVPYVSLSPTAGPLWIAYEAGFFKRNVGTELLYIPGGSTIIQAIISGDVNIANMAPPSPLRRTHRHGAARGVAPLQA